MGSIIVFGPAKSGKTIFCENMAMDIAVGKNEFLGSELVHEPKRVLFLSLEEPIYNRLDRNIIQWSSYNEEEKSLLNENYLYQQIDFPRFIVNEKDWNLIDETISESGAEVVFLDSITRLVPGDIDSSRDVEKIMQKLREITYSNNVTLFCIHHTPKMQDSPITLDKIRGSVVFGQESDFAIGVNKTTTLGHRYIKEVFYRYAIDDLEYVEEFEINNSQQIEIIDKSDEMEIVQRTDRRRRFDARDTILEFLNKNSNERYAKNEIVDKISLKSGIKERMIESYLSKLVKENKILNTERGYYASINYKNENENENSK